MWFALSVGGQQHLSKVCESVCVGDMRVCVSSSIFLVEAFGGNAQLAKSVKYLSGKRHRDEAALLLSMFTSMSRELETGQYGKKTGESVCVCKCVATKCCVGVFVVSGTLRFSALFQFTRPYCLSWSRVLRSASALASASASFECWENS